MRVAIYTRISTDEERQPYSLEAQSERLARYIESQYGWHLVRTFTDQCSGATLERPELQRALREAKAGRFDLLLVYRVDRLARSVRGLAHILETLDGAGVAFRSATEPFDTATSAGRMMVQMLGVFAEFERATIVDRVVAGMERKAARGGWASGTPPYGYSIDAETGRLRVRDDEAPLVPVIFDMYARQRLGSRSIAMWLNEHGYRTRKRHPWNSRAVLVVLRNRAYVGGIWFRDRYHPAQHEQLVDEELFDAAQQVMTARGDDRGLRRTNSTDYLLAGTVICDQCGRHYIGTAAHGRGGRYRYYTCWTRQTRGRQQCDSDRLPAPALESAVVEALWAVLTDTELIDRAIAAWRDRTTADRPRIAEQLAQVDTELRDVEQTIERYLRAFEERTLPEETCGERLRALSGQAHALRQRRADLVASTDADDSVDQVDVDAIRARLSELLREPSEQPARKALLRLLIEEIRVASRESIQPTFRVPLDGTVRLVDGVERETRLELATPTLAR